MFENLVCHDQHHYFKVLSCIQLAMVFDELEGGLSRSVTWPSGLPVSEPRLRIHLGSEAMVVGSGVCNSEQLVTQTLSPAA